MSSGCAVCRSWHDNGQGGDCGHWCHFAGAEDWDSGPREDGENGE